MNLPIYFDQLVSAMTGCLGTLPEKLTPIPGQTISNVAASLSSINGLTATLRTLQKDTFALAKAAQGSYIHENTFLKLVLMDSACGRFRFRVHWWKPCKGQAETMQNIHNHRFHFFSFVLLGTMTNIIWASSMEGMRFVHYHYLPRLGQDSYLLSEVGSENLRIIDVNKISTGSIYYLDRQTLHVSEPDASQNIVTLFVEDRFAIRPYADVYSNRYEGTQNVISSPSLSPTEYIKSLSDVISLLKLHRN